MRSFLMASAASAATLLALDSASAQSLPPGVALPPGVTIPSAGGSTMVISLDDGTRIESTLLTPTTMRILLTGGPNFGPNPATVNVTNLQVAGAEVLYSGNVMIAGSTTPFNCRMNTSTSAISGDAICGPAFGGSSSTATPTTPTVPVTPTIPTVPTTPTTPTTPATPTTPTTPSTPTTTPNGAGGTTTTVTTPGATVTVTNPAEPIFIRNVQAEQFLLSMVADRVSVANAQNYIAARMQQMELAGLAPGGLRFGKAGGGMAAGEAIGGMTPGVWANANAAYLRDDRIGSGVNGTDASAVVGADLSNDAFTVGVFGAYGRLKLSGIGSDFKSDGWTGGAYARWKPSTLFRVTATVGAGNQDVRFDRIASGLRSVGTTDRDSRFASVSVDSQLPLGPKVLAIPTAAVLFSSSDTDGYTDQAGRRIAASDSDLSLGSVGTTLFYQASGALPFVQASLNHQFNEEPGVDRTYALFGAGVVAPIGRTVTLVLNGQTIAWKSKERETRFAITLRRNF